ncbi:DUF2782 domain-containing protein [Aquitalea magnusonii]|uniref:DUF2782 domain-containing protein n=1 Tax=Aquitalea magnusonii TaxID=332411 RepID=UPI000B075F86|nr:DUF2782 domain-containing protein [Aquitalea magnusonii]
MPSSPCCRLRPPGPTRRPRPPFRRRPPFRPDAAATAEPEVRIIQRGDDKIEEYRLNGQLYMMKVTPAIGFPYYLMDEEGNGSMKQVDPNRRIVIPQWVLKRF